ncbi:hypothetical protein [Paraburkholderia bannensis]|uniref:hypothetical protein n=1 Tax=Paraburkholderia bannensis TaxID=765414 RepID=UPI002ABE3C57|nr:hypothetical protein [Paraburkholderia bannensis]
MNDTQHALTVARDVAEDRLEIEVAGWNALDSEARICLSCGVKQSADGSIPCGH